MRANAFSSWRGVFLLLLLVACSDQREPAVDQYLRQQIALQSGGAVALESFTKTNGYEQNLGGTKFYVLEWQARLSVLVDLWKNGGAFEGYWTSFGVMTKPPSQEDMIWARLGPTMPKEFVKGATVVLTGESQLQKTENGWRVVGSRVKTEQVLNNERSPAAVAELQRQQELAMLAQQKAQAAEQQRLAAIAENEAREREDARKRREDLYMSARNSAVPLGQVECTVVKEGTGSSFMINEVWKHRFSVTSAGVTKELIGVRPERGTVWSTPTTEQRYVVWFDELVEKPGYNRGSASSLDRVIYLNSERLGPVRLYCDGDQRTRTAADYLGETFKVLEAAIDSWRAKFPALARW